MHLLHKRSPTATSEEDGALNQKASHDKLSHAISPPLTSSNHASAHKHNHVVRSDGVDFTISSGASSPTHHRLFGNLTGSISRRSRSRGKSTKPATTEHKSRSLLPAFAHHSRSESCSAAISPDRSPDMSSRASPATATPSPRKLVRPRMIRKASSAGDLGNRDVLSPRETGRFARQQATSRLTLALASDAPPTRYESLRGPTMSPQLASSSRFRSPKLTNRANAASGPSAKPSGDVAQLTVNGQTINFHISADGNMVIQSAQPLEFEWRCTSSSSMHEYQLHVCKVDDNDFAGRTPMLSSSPGHHFSTLPALSPSDDQESPESPEISTPSLSMSSGRFAKLNLRQDMFWHEDPPTPCPQKHVHHHKAPRPLSPLSFDAHSSDSDMPATPRRYNMQAQRHERQKRDRIQVVSDDVDAASWQPYDTLNPFYGQNTKPSSLAERRLGHQARQLQLGLARRGPEPLFSPLTRRPSSLYSTTPNTLDREVSHWSETETSDSASMVESDAASLCSTRLT